jgi:hypothetical protein
MRLALAAVAVLALIATACGAASEPDLEQAAERTEATGSFGFEMTARRVESGEEMEWRECVGAADRVLRRARLACEGAFVMLTIGGSTYYNDGTGDGKWWKGDEEPLAELEPEKLLDVLGSPVREPERVGEESVRGIATVHYAVTVACENVGPVECETETTVADVWVDNEGFVRRIRVEEGRFAMIVEYYDFGEPVDIEAPRADEIFEAPLVDPRCKANAAAPIGVDDAVQAFRGHGFEVQLDEGTCGGPVAGSFSTTLQDGSMGDEDNLTCVVNVQPLTAGSASLRTGPPVVDRRLGNIECTLWVEGHAAQEAIGRLDAALAELKP